MLNTCPELKCLWTVPKNIEHVFLSCTTNGIAHILYKSSPPSFPVNHKFSMKQESNKATNASGNRYCPNLARRRGGTCNQQLIHNFNCKLATRGSLPCQLVYGIYIREKIILSTSLHPSFER